MSREPEVTHKIMAAIKSQNTEPEMLLRKSLWKKGYRFRVNDKRLKGKPDIVFTRAKIAIFCDGDYWHGHNWKVRGMPSLEAELSGYSEFWREKITSNVERDARNNVELQSQGWVVIRLWESDIRRDISNCLALIEATYSEQIAKVISKR